MSKVSKTARASAGVQATQKKVIPDADLIKNLRSEVENGIYPSIQGSHALLRAHDALLTEFALVQAGLDTAKADLATAQADVEHFKRQLVLANSIIETKDKALSDIATVAGVDLSSLRTEPGLTGTQGQDSTGG